MQTKFYKIAREIDNSINNFSTETFGKIRKYLEKDEYLNYFFLKISEYDNPNIYSKILFNNGYFNPDKNPSPESDILHPGFFRIPYWQALNYLNKVIENNIEEKDTEINKSIVSIINGIIEYKKEKDERIDNYHTDVFILKTLSKLPIEFVKKTHIEYFRIALQSRFGGDYFGSHIGDTILPKLIENRSNELLEILLQIMFSYKEDKDGTSSSLKAFMSNYWLGDALSKNHEDIIQVLEESSVIIPFTFVKKIITNNESSFSSFVVSTIEDINQKYGLDKYEIIIISFLRDALISTEPDHIYNIIESMIKAQPSIYRRLAIYTINIKYQSLKNILWENFPAEIDEYEIKHELYELIKNHAKDFDEDELHQLIQKIEMITDTESDIKMKTHYGSYRKKGWYKTLLISDNKEIIKLYDKYSEIIPGEVEEPGRPFKIEFRWGDGAPDDAANIETMEVKEIVKYLNKHANDKYTNGLDRRFSMYVKNDLKKYLGALKDLEKLEIPFKHSLIMGFYESFRKPEFDWEQVIEFILQIIKQPDFWKREVSSKEVPNRTWLISAISNLLNEGMRRDEDAFDEGLLPIAKKVLIELYIKSHHEELEDKNIREEIINAPFGRIYSALVNYSLRYARAKNQKKEKWDNDIKVIFTKNLDRECDEASIFSDILGRYYINLAWLDEDWVNNNIDKIFPKNNLDQWNTTMGSYLFHNPQLYKNIYDEFKKNGFWVKAIENLHDENSKTRLVGYILTGYFHSFEKMEEEGSLIQKLITMNDEFINKEMIVHCSRMYGFEFVNKTDNDLSLKIQNLWSQIFNNVNDETIKENRRILSDLCKWLKLISNFNEDIYKLCQVSAKYASVNHNIPSLMEGFENHIEEKPEDIGKLILIMIKSKYNSFYESEKEKFIKFVKILYKEKQKEIADEICNHFGMRGVHYLREYWEQNN